MDKTLSIKSHRGEYQVHFEDDPEFMERLKKPGSIWVVDRNVFNLYRPHFDGIPEESLILFDAKEQDKTPEKALELCRMLAERSCKRNTDFISVGGGITQDVTGFTASVFNRGLRWHYVPTTLLAQADSCIGGKTSLNLDSYKNLLGTFYAPSNVHISTEFLDTLGPREIQSGMGEIVKLFLIKARTSGDLAGLKVRFESNSLDELLHESLKIKQEFIEEDEFDLGHRKILNYGHCFGHALESVSEFGIPHGLAVMVGMIFATIVARRRNLVDDSWYRGSVNEVLIPEFRKAGLKLEHHWFDLDDLWEAMLKDKKRTGDGAAIILPESGMEPELWNDLTRSELIRAVDELTMELTPGK